MGKGLGPSLKVWETEAQAGSTWGKGQAWGPHSRWETEAQASPYGERAGLGPLTQGGMKFLQLGGASDTSTRGKAKVACRTASQDTHPRPSRLLPILNSEHTETTSMGGSSCVCEAAEKMNCRFKSLRTEDWRVSDTNIEHLFMKHLNKRCSHKEITQQKTIKNEQIDFKIEFK